MLNRMRPPKVPSSLCTFCHESDETIPHLFISCSYVKSLWNSFTEMWGNSLGVPTTLTKKQILLGDPSFSLLLNHIIIIIRKTIYDSKLKITTPSFTVARANVKYAQQLEGYISKKTGTLDIYLYKWGGLSA